MRACPLRFSVALSLIAAFTATVACREKSEGAPRVIVVGDEPRLTDPTAGPLSGPDALLVSSVAQGLVRFDESGDIVGGLAERWNVSDDGLSYIFRIASTDWANGGKVTAQQVARVLKRSVGPTSKNSLKDGLGAVDDVVAMTDRVIEIRLKAPRPNLLALLAQPEFGILRSGYGTGPFRIDEQDSRPGELRLRRQISSPDDETIVREEVFLAGATAAKAVRTFAAGKADLVLGGTFANLPSARFVKLPRNSLQFDPASGLFGLVVARANGPLSDPEVRRLLNAAIDRDALIAPLQVPGLTARTTVLEQGLDGVPAPVQPPWFGRPLVNRRPALIAASDRLFGTEKPTIRIFVGEGPGADLLFGRLTADWRAIGLNVERATSSNGADVKLVDVVAPSSSPAWFLRQFRCKAVPVCDEETDQLMDAARDALVPAQRYALLAQAASRIDDSHVFMPLAAPIRWNLVARRIPGFAGNRYARHTLTDLEQKPTPGGS
jgi:oligopeptide transport system substrate-binding protein